jgi:hypothetical protein
MKNAIFPNKNASFQASESYTSIRRRINGNKKEGRNKEKYTREGGSGREENRCESSARKEGSTRKESRREEGSGQESSG